METTKRALERVASRYLRDRGISTTRASVFVYRRLGTYEVTLYIKNTAKSQRVVEAVVPGLEKRLKKTLVAASSGGGKLSIKLTDPLYSP